MKKSEIRLIITGIASLVIAVILAVITTIVFITNVTMAADVTKIQEGFESIRSTIESVAEDVSDVNVDIDVEQISENLNALEEITG